MLKIILLLFVFCLIFIKCIAYDFIIDLNSNESIVNCGGPINKNDTSKYSPCKSFFDLGNRIRQIQDFKEDATLNIYVVVNEDNNQIIVKETEYLGVINNFNDIKIIVINQDNQLVNKDGLVFINGSSSSYFVSISSSLDTSNLTMKGISFLDWGGINSIIKASNCSLYFENIIFDNSNYILKSNDNNIGPSFYNCQFRNINNNNYVKIDNSKSTKINNCSFIDNIYKGLLIYSQYVIITQCSFINNIVVEDYLLRIENYVNILIEDISFENNNIPSIIYTDNKDNLDSKIKINNLQFTNNNKIVELTENYIFNFFLFKSYTTITLNNIYIDIGNQTINGVLKYPDINSTFIINNLQPKNNNNFINIFSISDSKIIVNNSSLFSKESFISGNDNYISIYNSSYDETLIMGCNTINNRLICEKNTNSNESYNKNKKIAIIIPVVLFSIILVIVVGLFINHLRKKKKLKKQNARKSKKQNNIINEIVYEDSGATDNDIANHGSDDTIGPNFLNDPDDIGASTE